MNNLSKPIHTSNTLPLVVDLDGTLICTDILFESALLFLKNNPLNFFTMIIWLFKGRAYLKERLTHRINIDIDTLPFNQDLLSYIENEKSKGRTIFLATASNQLIAQKICDKLSLFDGLMGSNTEVNLKGKVKASALNKKFPSGFSYAGDSYSDLAIWNSAKEIILVNCSCSVAKKAYKTGKVTEHFPRPSQWRATLKGARLHQWSKNTLVFLPLILTGHFTQVSAITATALSFLALCLVASSTYFFNDLMDLNDDRKHWSKKSRPLASGTLNPQLAIMSALLALTTGFIVAFIVSIKIVLLIGLYIAISLSYSLKLKQTPLLDTFIIAFLFSLRIIIGVIAAQADFSPWLIVLAMFFFNSLSLCKRYTELKRATQTSKETSKVRGYLISDLPLIMATGVATGFGAVLIMVLYLINDAFLQTFYGNTTWLWGFPVTLHLFLCRIWLICHRGLLDDDPVIYTLKDPLSLVLLLFALVCFTMAWLN